MYILEWIVWSIGVFILFIQVCLINNPDPGAGRLAKRYSIFLLTGLLLTVFMEISKFHLIWWIPVGFIINLLFFSSSVYRGADKFKEKMKEENDKDKSS